MTCVMVGRRGTKNNVINVKRSPTVARPIIPNRGCDPSEVGLAALSPGVVTIISYGFYIFFPSVDSVGHNIVIVL